MTVRINKQKINLREKLTEFEDKVNATQSLDALVDTSRNIDITNLSTSGESIRNSGAVINNRFVPFGPHARVLDLDPNNTNGLKGFKGGFTDGRYGYFVPNYHDGSYQGKVARVDLNDFSSVDMLDLDPDGTLDPANTNGLKGFQGGFTDGRYGYFVPNLQPSTHGNVARVDLSDFSSVSSLNLGLTDGDLVGFAGGFTDGRYGYLVPGTNSKIPRIDLNDFTTVSYLDLDPNNVGGYNSFRGGFTDGVYGYFSSQSKFVRFNLKDFNDFETLNFEDDSGNGGCFTDGRYAYTIPYRNSANQAVYDMYRIDLIDFKIIDVLKLNQANPGINYNGNNNLLAGFLGGFTDGRYGYLVPHYSGGPSRSSVAARVDLNDFSTVDVLDFSNTDSGLRGFQGGFTDGRYGYFVPNYNGAYNGKIARIQLFNGGNF